MSNTNMIQNIIKTIAVLVLGATLLTGCEKNNNGIVGKWQWTSTTLHYVNSYMGQDITENMDYLLYKDLTFNEEGEVDVLQQGIGIPEEEPNYSNYQYNYSLNAAADTVHLTDPQGEYASQA